MIMQYGLSKNVVLRINHVLEQYPAIEKAVMYGSRAKDNFKPASDIDLVLKGDNINISLLSHLMLKLDDLLLSYKFDVSIYNHITNPALLDHIERVA